MAVLPAAALMLFAHPAQASEKSKAPSTPQDYWVMSLEGGRKLTWQHTFSSQIEFRSSRKFWTKVFDVIAGEPEYHSMVRPFSITVDNHGRVIVTDPGAQGVHIFDFTQHKYKFLERKDKYKDPMLTPQCVAVDAQDNIYVTDSEAGKIFVFDSNGKYQHAIGSLKGGEGFFKRPTGIAVDSAAQRIYVTDTLRHKIYVLDMQGNVMQTIGKEGLAEGEFNLPTELRLDTSNPDGPTLLVVDAMNFRVQAFDRSGAFKYAIGQIGDSTGAIFRPKAVSVDSEGHLYIVDALWGIVQVFNQKGELLYYFGKRGTEVGEFQLPEGLYIDHEDRVYVVDSFNHRVQVFQYQGLKTQPEMQTKPELKSHQEEIK
jgi:DNA-binding beta-propeller fold protein YncE